MTKRLRAVVLAVVLHVLWPATGPVLAGQAPADDSLRVYVMTMGVGEQVWEKFGHNAIWIDDSAGGTSLAYNWGMFDFQQEDFLTRFIQGRMWYWMAGFDAQRTVESYVRHDRSVWVQELALTPAQKRELRAFVEWNALEANKFYSYDYYRDNCSTRVRDAIDRVLDGRLRAQTDTIPTATTFRSHTQRLVADDVPLYTGMMLALGEPVDHALSAWEEMFLPIRMQETLRRATVVDADGREMPLVVSERALYLSTEHRERETAPEWIAGYLLTGTLIGALLVWLAQRGAERPAARRWFAIVGGGWALAVGIAGLAIAYLWGLTDHEATYRNENVLQANLLALPLVYLVPRASLWSRRAGRVALVVAGTMAGLALVGLLLKLVPGFMQRNLQMIALFLPAHLGLFGGVWVLTNRARWAGGAAVGA